MTELFTRAREQGYFVIAEIGVNYYDIATKEGISLMDAAKLMIDEAHESGLDAVKFQSYKAEKLASRFSPSYWDTSEEATTSQFELFKKFDSFGEAEYRALARYCEERGIVFLSTPFDFESADYLEPLMPLYKISSSDITNLPFIRHMAAKGKPILLSTGASNMEEVHTAVQTIRSVGEGEIALLHCVLEYPTPFDHANLNMIPTLGREFPELALGYSDHTRPDPNMDVLKTASTLGALFLEKHFTLDKTLPGNDHYHAMDPKDASKLMADLPFLVAIRGEGKKRVLDSERLSRQNARRSLVAAMDLPKGTKITSEMLVFKRPGTGISPGELERVLGLKATRDIKEDETITWDHVT